MPKKIVATLVAVLLALGVSLATATPATAASDGRPHPGQGWSDNRSGHDGRGGGGRSADAPAPAPSPSPSSSAPARPAPAAPQAPAVGGATSRTTTTPTALYGVGLYVYKKVDTGKPASWANSGPQRLLVQDLDNPSADANPWYTSLDAALLPADVCGPGWAVQQDKVAIGAGFTTFPATITPPVDNIGWPPLYAAKHQELSAFVSVPDCGPPPSCIPDSAVSYTYDPATNSGVITVAAPPRSTGELCSPFWVTATSWKYLGTSTWIQKLDQVQKLGRISEPGSYPYAAPVACGQGDIYASFDGDDATLDPTGYLYGPDDPFDENFLHEMGFAGPRPTYMNTMVGCNELAVAPTSTPPSCTTDGGYTLPLTPHVTWYRDGAELPAGDYTAAAGATVEITAVADESWVIAGGVQDGDTHRWSRTWTLDFPRASECLTLVGSMATGSCVADSPWIDYTVTLTDPYDQASSREARIVLTDGSNSVTLDLGSVPASGTLSGRVLWPGASVDPVTGAANGWPGWEQVGGEWRPTTGNFAWTRAITEATIEVNPSLVVALSYPPATPDCATEPPHDPPTLGLFPTSAQLSEQCTSDGRGVLSLGQVDGVSFFEDVNYFIDGVPASAATVSLAPGTYRVTVTVKNPSDGLDGPSAWNVTVSGGQVCGELETLALTGFDGGYLVAFAAMLVAAGAALLVTGRGRSHRTE